MLRQWLIKLPCQPAPSPVLVRSLDAGLTDHRPRTRELVPEALVVLYQSSQFQLMHRRLDG